MYTNQIKKEEELTEYPHKYDQAVERKIGIQTVPHLKQINHLVRYIQKT